MRSRDGYTLVEMLVAMAVGMLVVQIAFTSFFFIQKYVRRIERMEATNQVAQTAVLWAISKGPVAGSFPTGTGLNSRIGCWGVSQVDAARNIYQYVIHDFSNPQYIHWLDRQLALPVQP